ncbi:MAG: hypothetical protein JO196_17165, partial [Hyphomicrobiales bacterium]|nr:hypothetical protein [Hyphomicrobiales bacterium]
MSNQACANARNGTPCDPGADGYKASMPAPSVNAAEVERFDRLASTWWDQEGPMRALHAMNPARLAWIRRETASHFGLDP